MRMNERKSISIFIVTKPLQYFNVTNIKDDCLKICLIINNFKNAEIFYQKISTKFINEWNRVIFYESIFQAYKWIIKNSDSIINLYVDSDYGLRKYYYFEQISHLNIYVYEEGLGNYRRNLRKKSIYNDIINYLYKLMGHESYLGGSKYTKCIYLYDINKHRKLLPHCRKELRFFNKNFIEHLSTFSGKEIFLDQGLNYIYSAAKGKKVVLYLTSWIYHQEVDGIMLNYPEHIKILKPHPHFKIDFCEMQDKYQYIINGENMVEFFIYELLKQVNELVVIHRRSSALMYFDGISNLKSLVI